MFVYETAVTGTDAYVTPWIALGGRRRYNVTNVFSFEGDMEGELSVEFTNSKEQDRDAGTGLVVPFAPANTSLADPIVVAGVDLSDLIELLEITGGAVRFKYVNSAGAGVWRNEYESRPL